MRGIEMSLRKLMCAGMVTLAAFAQSYKPAESNLKARQWFQDAKFGLFIHWGVYSVLGRGEWVMNEERIPIPEYEKLAGQFNPAEFDPAAWVSLAKAAGMKYITITSKHHDGFAMWDTKQNQWNIVDATPYGKDVLKKLADECHRQGIKLFFYHSQLDWRHPDYYPRGGTGHYSRRPERGDFNRYLDFMDAQLRELLTGYGEIGGIWFDGWWDKPNADWRLDRTYSLIHTLQPAALIGSNHHRKPSDGEDFQMFEKDLPGGRTATYNDKYEVGDLPLETCDTINTSWGYNKSDKKFKSTSDLIRYLVRAAGNDANFLLNVGPMPNGQIQPEFVERLKGIGAWMQKNGESVYGTRGGPVKARPWGVMTRKPGKIYVHVMDWPDELLLLPKLPPVKSARLLSTGETLELTPVKGQLVLRVPQSSRDAVDTVVVMETQP
jgi:alpha-L-fucosidase